jgi:hypothetical protein
MVFDIYENIVFFKQTNELQAPGSEEHSQTWKRKAWGVLDQNQTVYMSLLRR